MSTWEILWVKHDKKTGAVIEMQAREDLEPMTEEQARKMAWACDVWNHIEYRVRPIGDQSIGLPHNWLNHAPPIFFRAFKH